MHTQWTKSVTIVVNGSPLDPTIADQLLRVVVENSMHLPDIFELTFINPARTDPLSDVVTLGGFVIDAVVAIMATGGDQETQPLVVGEITAIEFEYDFDGPKTIIRGLDMSHRLFRGKKTRFFQDLTASDIVTAIISESGVAPGRIVTTDRPIPYLVQAGTSDWRFIQKLAADNGYRAWMSDGVFNFGPVAPPVKGDVPGTYESSTATQLVVGQSVRRLRAVVRSSEQVSSVQVMGWSSTDGAPILGEGVPEVIGTEILSQPEEMATATGANQFSHLWSPTGNEEGASTQAEAIGNQIAESYVELDGESIGTTSLKAGVAVNLNGAGETFDGGYTLTATRHVFDPDTGYTTHFNVSGWQDRTMYGLTSGRGGSVVPGVINEPFRIPGVVSALVLDTKDPEDQGRVQLTFPWMGDPPVASDWVRCTHFGVDEGSGSLFVPEIGTEVLVAFEMGDPSKPYVLGGLYSTVRPPAGPPELIDESTGLVGARRISSRLLHNITFYDSDEKNGIFIQTGDELAVISLDAEEQIVTIKNEESSIQITSAGITVTAVGDMTITAEGALSLSGASISIEGEADVSISGATVALEGEGSLSIDAPMVEING